MKEKMLLLSTFLKYPKEIGSIIPSSKFLIKEILKNIEFKNERYIVEYGPGTGCVTTEIVRKARQDAKILCFETNKNLCAYLRKRIRDKRLTIINDSAENIGKHMKDYNLEEVDCVIAVLSFSTLGFNKKRQIFTETRKVLRNNGKFVFCRYLPHFEKNLGNYFLKISANFVPWNVPPAIVYTCTK